MKALLATGDSCEQDFVGVSGGLNAPPRAGRYEADMWILPTAVTFGRAKPGIRTTAEAERVAVSEIPSGQEVEVPRTGFTGAMGRRTSSDPLGGVFKRSTEHPAILLSTRRGDITFGFDDKQRGQVRAAFVAISDLIN